MTGMLNFFFKKVRISKAMVHLKDGSRVLDIGSGLDAELLHRASGKIRQGIGLDYRAQKFQDRKIEVRKFIVRKKLPFKSGSFDHVVMLAMLEHLKHPESIAKECNRVLRQGGSLIITTPTPTADKILHIMLAVKLPFIFSDEEEASKHETCFTPAGLAKLVKKSGFKKVDMQRFELGLNTLVVAYK